MFSTNSQILKSMKSKPALALASILSTLSLSAQFVSEDFSSTTLVNGDVNDSNVGQFGSSQLAVAINDNFNSDNAIAIEGNIEGASGAAALTYAFDSTGLTGEISVSFDLAVIDDGNTGAGELANPTISFTLWEKSTHGITQIHLISPVRMVWLFRRSKPTSTYRG